MPPNSRTQGHRTAAGRHPSTLVLALAGAVATVVAMASPSAAVESYSRPAGTTITVAGHGWGHGHGMSQWGAYGAATKGLSSSQILAFYYPGTSRSTTYGNPFIRVQLRALGYSSTTVVPGTTLSGRGSDGVQHTYVLADDLGGTAITAWRAVRSSSAAAFLLQRKMSNGTWITDGALKNTPYDMVFTHPVDGWVTVLKPAGGSRQYEGTVTATLSGSSMTSVNRTRMDDYLKGVVPSEMPASWPAAALQTQAVAARTYAAFDILDTSSTAKYDTCDTTSCQVYSGLDNQDSRATSAVTSTSGLVVTYSGKPAFTQFSSSNGGWMAKGSQPYLVAKPDPYDGVVPNSVHSWTASLPVGTIQSAFPSTGTFQRLEMVSRDGNGEFGGRILTIRVVGSAGSSEVSGDTFRGRVGLKSEWFAPTSAPAVSSPAFPRDVTDDGRADLLAVTSGGSLVVAKGNGSSGFGSPMTAGGGWGSLTMVRAVGPFGPDNRGDVVGRRADGGMWLYPGSSTGAFTASPSSLGRGWNAIDEVAAPGDWDGDGHLDLLGREAATGRLWLYTGTGDGRISNRTLVGTGWGGMRQVLSSGDFTGDGKPDVLALSSGNVLYVYPGNGSGGWLARRVVTAGFGSFNSLIGPGDITGDGKPDLLARRTSDGAMILYAGDGQGGVAPGQVVLTGWGNYSTIVP